MGPDTDKRTHTASSTQVSEPVCVFDQFHLLSFETETVKADGQSSMQGSVNIS